MHINSPGMDLMESLFLVHLGDIRSSLLVDQLIFVLIDVPHGKFPGRVLAAAPGKTPALAPYLLHFEKYRDSLAKIRKKRSVIQRQRKLRRGRPDMSQLDEKVIRVHHRILAAA